MFIVLPHIPHFTSFYLFYFIYNVFVISFAFVLPLKPVLFINYILPLQTSFIFFFILCFISLQDHKDVLSCKTPKCLCSLALIMFCLISSNESGNTFPKTLLEAVDNQPHKSLVDNPDNLQALSGFSSFIVM